MLERLVLRNFQPHQKLIIDFAPGVTTLCGESGRGKSAVIRALLWAVTNKPRGDSFVAHGETECSVRLYFDGRRLVRRFARGAHGYQLDDGDVLKAFGTEVPVDIRRALNVGPANIQRQFDPHWMLSLTPGAVSQELNNIVNLGVIDDVQAEASARLRKVTAEVELTRDRLKEAEAARDALAWVPAYCAKVEELSRKRELVNNLRARATQLEEAATGAETAEIVYSRASEAASRYGRAVVVGRKAVKLQEKLVLLEELLIQYDVATANAECRIPDLTRLRTLKARIESLTERANTTEKLIDDAEYTEGNYREAAHVATEARRRFREEVGDECPVCGGPMKELSDED